MDKSMNNMLKIKHNKKMEIFSSDLTDLLRLLYEL